MGSLLIASIDLKKIPFILLLVHDKHQLAGCNDTVCLLVKLVTCALPLHQDGCVEQIAYVPIAVGCSWGYCFAH